VVASGRASDVHEAAPVFVVGAPRSGTTLVRLTLSDHRDLAIGPETHFLGYWLGHHPGLQAGDRAEFERFFAAFTTHEKWPRYGLDRDGFYAELTANGTPDARTIFTTIMAAQARNAGKPRFGEKTPGHYAHLDRLLSWYPHARVVFMVRDPRAVVASLVTLDREWAPSEALRWSRVWATTIDRLEAHAGDPRVREVRYERLVASPEEELGALLEFLELAPIGGFGVERAPDPVARVHGTFSPRGPIRAGSVERWRSVLTAQQVGQIEAVTRAPMLRHGYEPVTRRTALRVKAAIRRDRRQRQRARLARGRSRAAG
jgi:sulfotransferase family protein